MGNTSGLNSCAHTICAKQVAAYDVSKIGMVRRQLTHPFSVGAEAEPPARLRERRRRFLQQRQQRHRRAGRQRPTWSAKQNGWPCSDANTTSTPALTRMTRRASSGFTSARLKSSVAYTRSSARKHQHVRTRSGGRPAACVTVLLIVEVARTPLVRVRVPEHGVSMEAIADVDEVRSER